MKPQSQQAGWREVGWILFWSVMFLLFVRFLNSPFHPVNNVPLTIGNWNLQFSSKYWRWFDDPNHEMAPLASPYIADAFSLSPSTTKYKGCPAEFSWFGEKRRFRGIGIYSYDRSINKFVLHCISDVWNPTTMEWDVDGYSFLFGALGEPAYAIWTSLDYQNISMPEMGSLVQYRLTYRGGDVISEIEDVSSLNCRLDQEVEFNEYIRVAKWKAAYSIQTNGLLTDSVSQFTVLPDGKLGFIGRKESLQYILQCP